MNNKKNKFNKIMKKKTELEHKNCV